MNQQIIFTSVAQGLDARESGFCAVGSSPGMPKSLADALKRLSGYKHCFSPGDTRNPTVHMAQQVRHGGQMLHVLSQITDAGLDQLGRPNKVAHHVVFNGHNPLPSCGPAHLLAQQGWMRNTWDTAPALLPPAELPDISSPPETCMTWYQQTGDAGWGGYLAQAACEPKHKPVALLYRSPADPLQLFIESLALLDPVDRWNVPFTTFAHTTAQDDALRWLAAPVDTPPAQQFLQNPRYTTLDLTATFHPAEDSAWVDRARRAQPQDTQNTHQTTP